MRPTTVIASTLLFFATTLIFPQTPVPEPQLEPQPEPPPIKVEYPNVPKLLTPRIATSVAD